MKKVGWALYFCQLAPINDGHRLAHGLCHGGWRRRKQVANQMNLRQPQSPQTTDRRLTAGVAPLTPKRLFALSQKRFVEFPRADVPAPNKMRPAVIVASPVPPAVTGSVPVVSTDEEEAYTAPPEVNVVRFVPPLAVANVPATVTAPEVAVAGVRPVAPNEIVATLTVVALLANSLTVPLSL